MKTDISVCIPVYNTERYLAQCLESIAAQDFTGSVEVLVLSDASPGRDERGWSAEKIVKDFKKRFSNKFGMTKPACKLELSFRYLENSQNLALVENRRRLVNEAHGEYIFMLDSDDFLPQGALTSLYEAARKNDADVVQGDIITYDLEGKNHIESKNEAQAYPAVLEGKAVFAECFCNHKYRAFVTAKLIRRAVYERALEDIPYIKVLMAEDMLQYFFIALYAKKYIGINVPVYNYRIGYGITVKQISDIEDWRKVCSTASVITALYAWVEEKTLATGKNPLDQNEMKMLQNLAKAYCIDNVKQLRANVVSELYESAHQMLCDYWGEEAIKNTESFLNNSDCE